MTHDEDLDSDQSDGGKGRVSGKSRRDFPSGAVSTLKAWLLSPEHLTHPYPAPQDQAILMKKTGIDKNQLKNWYTNARRRIWKPMLKKQFEQGTLALTGAGSGGVAVGIAPGLMADPGAPAPTADNTSVDVQANQPNYQQAVQPQDKSQVQQQQQYGSYGDPVYTHQQYSSKLDILCGRDRVACGHIGNRSFRETIAMHRDKYQNARSRHEKTRITDGIIALIRERRGRFLRKMRKPTCGTKSVISHMKRSATHFEAPKIPRRNAEDKRQR